MNAAEIAKGISNRISGKIPKIITDVILKIFTEGISKIIANEIPRRVSETGNLADV